MLPGYSVGLRTKMTTLVTETRMFYGFKKRGNEKKRKAAVTVITITNLKQKQI